jgi:hypothetical protein
MSEIERPPTHHAADRAYEAARVGVAAVPFVGGSVIALLDAVLGPPLDRRRQRWFEEVADAIQTLQRQSVPVDSDEFVTAVARASTIAMGTHYDEKLAMLKAAIIHSALPDRPSGVIVNRLLRLVDELEPEHFIVLNKIRQGPNEPFETPESRAFMSAVSKLGGLRSPEPLDVRQVVREAGFSLSADELAMVAKDLISRDLLAVNTRDNTHESLSGLGNELLDFVTYIEPPAEEG